MYIGLTMLKVKVKLSLCLTKHHAMKTYWGVEVYLHEFLAPALDGGEWSASLPGLLTPRERAPGSHWIGGWVGPRAVLDAVVKRKIPSPRRESNSRNPIVQPVAQRYTDCAITVLFSKIMKIKIQKTITLPVLYECESWSHYEV
jgi:hypothetical protein